MNTCHICSKHLATICTGCTKEITGNVGGEMFKTMVDIIEEEVKDE